MHRALRIGTWEVKWSGKDGISAAKPASPRGIGNNGADNRNKATDDRNKDTDVR